MWQFFYIYYIIKEQFQMLLVKVCNFLRKPSYKLWALIYYDICSSFVFFFFFLGWKYNGSAQPNEDFESKESAETKMEVDIVCVWIHWSCCVSRLRFSIYLFIYFFFFVTLKRYCSSLLWTVAVTFDHEQCICALFMDPQITLFNNFFIKNGSYGTIYTFKNYFATVFSVFSFQFQQNKFYPNTP